MKDVNVYTNCMSLSSQFIMCGNCFRMDTYKECDFGCIYCFVNNSNFRQSKIREVANIDSVRRWFLEALDIGMKHTIKHELLNKRVPLQLGGQSDPFQKRESEYRVTLDLLRLSKEYSYPIAISTKTASLSRDYWEVLSPDIHTFQISLMGLSDSYVRRFEKLTPSVSERIKFIKELKDKGFWVSIRIQPVVDIKEVVELVENTQDIVDYYTVEHLKLPVGGANMYETYKQVAQTISEYKINFMRRGNEFEFDTESKRKNIELIKSITKVKIGCGDNDLHLLSDSFNCCGVDTMPPAFENWMKYNSMYIKMTGDRDVWYPTNSCNNSIFSKQRIPGNTSVVPYVERHIKKMYCKTSLVL